MIKPLLPASSHTCHPGNGARKPPHGHVPVAVPKTCLWHAWQHGALLGWFHCHISRVAVHEQKQTAMAYFEVSTLGTARDIG